MSVTRAVARPCGVQLCPALARDGSMFCVAHRVAKKLAQHSTARATLLLVLDLHVGDYVTLLSTSGKNVHAVCPETRARVTSRPLVDTPLFDAPVDVAVGVVHSGACIEALRDEVNSDDPSQVTCPHCIERAARKKPPTFAQARRAAADLQASR